MTIDLGPELERIVRAKVESGAYPSANDVVAAALLQLEESEMHIFDEANLDRLRKEIAIGIEQADRGELIDGEKVFAELRQRFGYREQVG